MKLQILIPQYKGTEKDIKPLLDSIAIQQGVSKDDISVVICNDGSDVRLSEEFIKAYPYAIEYHNLPHKGVSATRNTLLDLATSEYVMLCDEDDMFVDSLAFYLIFDEMNKGFDILYSDYASEEKKKPDDEKSTFNVYQKDGLMLHGKVFRLDFLNENKIRFNEDLALCEDCYFVGLCLSLADKIIYIPETLYLWKWRQSSVSRSDPEFDYKIYKNLLKSSDLLIRELLRRDKIDKAYEFVETIIIVLYFALKQSAWEESDRAQAYKKEVLFDFIGWLNIYSGAWFDIPMGDIIEALKAGFGENKHKNETHIIEGYHVHYDPEGQKPYKDIMQDIDQWIKRLINSTEKGISHDKHRL